MAKPKPSEPLRPFTIRPPRSLFQQIESLAKASKRCS